MTTVNPRSITDAERPWLEAWSLPVQVQLINLVKERTSNDVALALAGWLTAKHAGQDLAAMPTKARYRKILKELSAEGLRPDPARARVASGSRRRLPSVEPAGETAAAVAVARSESPPTDPPRMSELMSSARRGADSWASFAGRRRLALATGANEWAEGDVPDTSPSAPFTRPEDVLQAA